MLAEGVEKTIRKMCQPQPVEFIEDYFSSKFREFLYWILKTYRTKVLDVFKRFCDLHSVEILDIHKVYSPDDLSLTYTCVEVYLNNTGPIHVSTYARGLTVLKIHHRSGILYVNISSVDIVIPNGRIVDLGTVTYVVVCTKTFRSVDVHISYANITRLRIVRAVYLPSKDKVVIKLEDLYEAYTGKSR